MTFSDERTYIICGNIITDDHKSILRPLNPSDHRIKRKLVNVEVEVEVEVYIQCEKH